MIAHKIDMYRYGDELDAICSKHGKKCDVLFYGSSTFAIWKSLEDEFADFAAINAGFGGSTADEALFHYERVAKPFAPEVLLWYYGDNDPVCNYSAQETEELFWQTWQAFRKDFPSLRVVSVLTKTSPARDEYASYVAEISAWQREKAAKTSWLSVVETQDICKKDGDYLLDNYLSDQLHFGPKGYEILGKKIRAELSK